MTQNTGQYQLADFRIYNKYQARINWAIGEFDWDLESDRNS
jgi:hypothetical protein